MYKTAIIALTQQTASVTLHVAPDISVYTVSCQSYISSMDRSDACVNQSNLYFTFNLLDGFDLHW